MRAIDTKHAISTSIWGLTRTEVEGIVRGLGGRPIHARRLFIDVFARGRTLDTAADIPKGLCRALSEQLSLALPRVQQVQRAADGTMKIRFQARGDGASFESVYIPGVTAAGRTHTLCVSSQTGCAVGCTFCFTASIKQHRNLEAAEIVGQVVAAQRLLREQGDGQARITNIVFMGMGEPLLNYDSVVQAVRVLLEPEGLDFSRRRITISTAGIVPQIRRLGRDLGTLLAVSLNATTDEVRDRIMPINRRWPLAQLLDAMVAYPRPRGGRITVEYVLLDGINDGDADAHRLAKLLAPIPVKVNLLPLNEHARTAHRSPPAHRVQRFQQILWEAGYSAIVRTARGDEVAAACGQLGGS